MLGDLTSPTLCFVTSTEPTWNVEFKNELFVSAKPPNNQQSNHSFSKKRLSTAI